MTDVVFPSQAWFDAYRNRINENENYAATADGWGVDFNGDFVFRMTQVPLEGIDTDAMPDSLREQLETNLTATPDQGHVGQAVLGLTETGCTEARLIESADNVAPGFVLTAPYEDWVALIQGETGIVDGLMFGNFDLAGDKGTLMQHSGAANALIDTAGTIEATFLHEAFPD